MNPESLHVAEFDIPKLSTTEKFKAWGENLVSRSNGDFVLSKNDEYTRVDAQPYLASEIGDTVEGHEFVKFTADKIGERVISGDGFKKFVEAIRQKQDLLAQIEDLQSQGKNIAILTNHPWLMNIAVLQAGLYNAVDRQGFAKESGIIISNTLGWLDIVTKKNTDGKPEQTMGAIELLRQFCNIYTTVPQTASAEKFHLNGFAQEFNKQSGFKIIRTYHPKAIGDGRGKVLVVAASGSLDIVDPDTGDVTMQPVNQALAEKILYGKFDSALPITMFQGKDKQMSFAVGNLTKIQTPDTIHNLMISMSYKYEQLVGNGARVRYDDPRSLTS